jgi:hypothetical protein
MFLAWSCFEDGDSMAQIITALGERRSRTASSTWTEFDDRGFIWAMRFHLRKLNGIEFPLSISVCRMKMMMKLIMEGTCSVTGQVAFFAHQRDSAIFDASDVLVTSVVSVLKQCPR